MTTKADLERRIALLAERTGVDYGLETWAPGDGKRRYILTRSGGSHEIVRGLGAAEFEAILSAYIRGVQDGAINNRDRLAAEGKLDPMTGVYF